MMYLNDVQSEMFSFIKPSFSAYFGLIFGFVSLILWSLFQYVCLLRKFENFNNFKNILMLVITIWIKIWMKTFTCIFRMDSIRTLSRTAHFRRKDCFVWYNIIFYQVIDNGYKNYIILCKTFNYYVYLFLKIRIFTLFSTVYELTNGSRLKTIQITEITIIFNYGNGSYKS